MSMDTCAKCGDLVDTDDDPAFYDFGDRGRCEPCREKYYWNDEKIITHFERPPSHHRSFDWSAVTENYDADCDQDGFFSNDPIGHGATEDEAIADLKMEIEARA